MESFGPGKDAGIDFRFARVDDTTVIQVKHYVDSPTSALVRSAKIENEKVARLCPRRYIFVTSSSMSPGLKEQIIAAMPDAPIDHGDVVGREDLNNLIGRHPSVLHRHFKLWLTHTETLERILHSGIYNRTDAELDSIKRLIPRFVQNESVARAEAILESRGALVVAGEPGVGKTTLARVLTWLHLAQGWRVFVVEDLDDAMQVLTTGEKRLIFFDDFLGQISLTTDVIRHVDQRFPAFLERVRTNKDLRLIVTTRSYLLAQAQMQSDRLSSEKFAASELVLNVGSYTRGIRAKIVFNHIFFSDLTSKEKQALLRDDFYLKIIDHKNFNPRLIDMLTSSDYQAIQDAPITKVITTVLARPTALWEKPYRFHLEEDSRILMCALFFSPGYPSTRSLLDTFRRYSRELNPSADGREAVRFRQALKPLEGSIVSVFNGWIYFNNPGVRDFMTTVVIEDELILPALRAVTSFSALDAVWSFFKEHMVECVRQIPDESVWVRALADVCEDPDCTTMSHVRMALEMYEKLGEKSLAIEAAREALIRIEQIGIDSADEIHCRVALAIKWRLTENERAALPELEVLAQLSADMLVRDGASLAVEEIVSVAEAIAGFGDSRELAESAAESALREFLVVFPEKLKDISSTAELASFEDELKASLGRYNVLLSSAEMAGLENRRAELQDIENSQTEDSYESTESSAAEGDSSDREVKSLFATLIESAEVE
jgi:hypothetical protein